MTLATSRPQARFRDEPRNLRPNGPQEQILSFPSLPKKEAAPSDGLLFSIGRSGRTAIELLISEANALPLDVQALLMAA
jgi:hypothetical protein